MITTSDVLLSLLSGFLVVLPARITYDWGIPVAAFYWYRRDRTTGKLLFLSGFAIRLLVGLVQSLAGTLPLLVTFSFPRAFFSVLHVLGWMGMLLALAGFVLIVVAGGNRKNKPAQA
jgi:hypothetical protein